MHVASIRSLVLARDDVTLRCCGLASIAVCVVDTMHVVSIVAFIHGPLMDRHPWLRPGI